MQSHWNLSDDKVVKRSCLREYRSNLSVLGDELTYLHSNLSLLRQIRQFDEELFEAPGAIFQYLSYLLSTHSVLIVQRIWKDKPRSSLTLNRFVDWVIDKAVRQDLQDGVRAEVQAALPSAELEGAIERMRHIRHASIGHVDKRIHLGFASPPAPVSVREVEESAQVLGRLFNTVNFGSDMLFVLFQFRAPNGQWHEGDFGYLLEHLALGSKWFSKTLPETVLRQHMSELSPEQVSEIERLRDKYGFENK